MGKRKIIWSAKAIRKLDVILEFYAERNKNKTYSLKLYEKFSKELQLLLFHPEVGIKTEIEDVRGLIVDTYILFYKYDNNRIVILTLWDCRQNPDKLEFKI